MPSRAPVPSLSANVPAARGTSRGIPPRHACHGRGGFPQPFGVTPLTIAVIRARMLGVVNEKALRELGWSRICSELEARARTPMGRERSRSRMPYEDPDVARRQLRLVEEARLLRRHERELPLADAADVRPSLGRAAREGTLEGAELMQVARLIRAGDSARRFCFSQADRAPLHFERAQELSELVPLAQELERAFDPAGKLLDTASALLAELRERARGLHRAIKQRIEEMLKDENVVAMLRDLYYSVRGDRYDLRKARHPLLVLQRKSAGVVANDIALPPPAQALIVSGPNAGGKTVTITGVGLCALMARAGLPIPAEAGSRMPLYRTVYTAIGDEGDLSRDLSTFTAHLSALKWILEAAGPGTLALIDEIAADTDPREGAAIAVAALEKLVAAGAQVLITTHLEELKALALADPRFAPASVGFDVDRLAPTYLLKMGEVGASSAIEIARRVGISEEVCARAREILGKGASIVSEAVAKLEKERAETARLRGELESAREELARERAALQREGERLRELEQQTRTGARGELIDDLRRKREEVAVLVAQLQAAPAMAQAVEAQRTIESAVAAEEREQAQASKPQAAAETAIAVGARVKHLRLGTEGVVMEVQDGSATVQMGALRSKVPVQDLVPVARKVRQAGFRKSKAEQMQRAEQARPAAVQVRVPMVDLRGMRVDEALRTVELELDRATRAGEERVHMLHGHGSGALKSAVREHLQRSPYVAKARAAEQHEGGDGVTVVELA